jgi:class 3 adenylate cyclase/tetratricopeptide (TPR) repeat protein
MARDISEWLEDLGLGKYADAFAENEIDFDALPHVTEEDLKEIGIALGARRKLLAAIAALADDGFKNVFSSDTAVIQTTPEIPSEQRQVTVLFADLEGFTQLSGELGAEETHALLNRYFEALDTIVEGYGGSIDKHMGDNVMAVFGAPIAHANDPERAVRAAVDIQQIMVDLSDEFGRSLKAHIGVASGQVVASGTGSDAHHEYTVTGSSVNLASRLQDKAGGGETLVSQAVHRAVSDIAESAPMGVIEVKGFAEPIPAWKVKGIRDDGTVSQRGPLVGRRVERRQFAMLVSECMETGTGHAILVRGDAGIGKTRLVEEFASLAGGQGFASHRALVLDFGVGKGQNAVQGLVCSLLGLVSGGDTAARAAAADGAVEAGLLDADARVFLNDLLDLPQPLELRTLYDAMDNTTRNSGNQSTLAQLIKRISATRPILIAVEDVHWADPLILAHLAGIALTVADCPAVLVMTSRAEGDPLDQAWRAALGGAALTTMDLRPLRATEAEEMAIALAGTSSTFIQDCIARAEGNPLFLEQLLRNAEEGVLTEVPGSIQSLILARIDCLEPGDKQALQVASVIGQRFALEPLHALLEDAAYDCKALVGHHLVRPEGDGYLFAHALIREGVYSSMLQAQKRPLHRRAANWFVDHDPVLYAEHLDRAADSGAARAYRKAAESQATEYHYARALDLIESGLAASPDPSEVSRLICLKGDILLEAGDAKAASEAHLEARDLAVDDFECCRAEIGMAASMRLVDRFNDAFSALERAERLTEGSDWHLELARLHHLRGNLLFPLGQTARCQEEHEKAYESACAAGSPEWEAQTLGGLGDAAYARGCLITADSYYSRCIDLCRKHGFGRIEVANLPQLGGWGTRFYMGDVEGSLEISFAAVKGAKAISHDRAELIAQSGCYMALFSVGETDQARKHVLRAKALVEKLGARRFLARAMQYEGKIEFWEGRTTIAYDRLQEAMTISRETGIRFVGPSILADIAFVSENPDESREALREGEKLIEDGGLGANDFNFLIGAIETSLRLKDWDDVDRHCATFASYTASEPLPLANFLIARGRGLATWGRGHRGVEVTKELQELHTEAERLKLKTALPALDEALEDV